MPDLLPVSFVVGWTTVEASHVTQTKKNWSVSALFYLILTVNTLFGFLAFFFNLEKNEWCLGLFVFLVKLTTKCFLDWNLRDSGFFYRMPQCHTQTQPKYRFTCFLLSLEASCCIGTESTDCFYWDFFWSWWYSSTCWNETVALDIGTIMILKLEALWLIIPHYPQIVIWRICNCSCFVLIFFSLSHFLWWNGT